MSGLPFAATVSWPVLYLFCLTTIPDRHLCLFSDLTPSCLPTFPNFVGGRHEIRFCVADWASQDTVRPKATICHVTNKKFSSTPLPALEKVNLGDLVITKKHDLSLKSSTSRGARAESSYMYAPGKGFLLRTVNTPTSRSAFSSARQSFLFSLKF